MLHEQKEVAQIIGPFNGGTQVRLQHGAESGLALGLTEPLNVAHRLRGLALHNHGQPVLPAQPVRSGSDLVVVGLYIAVVLISSHGVDGVENDVGVDMLPIHMNADER